MEIARPRDDESASIAALRDLEVLDSEPEAEFEAIVRAASRSEERRVGKECA